MAHRPSSLDITDRNLISTLDQHPDLVLNYSNVDQPAHLQRNKAERKRLQGLQRTDTTASDITPPQPLTWRHKFAIWRINEGNRRFVFAAWILLHLLVLVFGFINYQVNDNYSNARATFGVTFGTSFMDLLHFFC